MTIKTRLDRLEREIGGQRIQFVVRRPDETDEEAIARHTAVNPDGGKVVVISDDENEF